MDVVKKVGCGREEITGIWREEVVVTRELRGGGRVGVEETDDDEGDATDKEVFDDDATDKEVFDDDATDKEVAMVESVNIEEVEETGSGRRESRS